LVGLGFGAGLVIGVVSEEPELLAGHLRGEGEAVELTLPMAEEASAADPSVAVEPVPVVETPPAPSPTRERPSPQALPAVAAAPRQAPEVKQAKAQPNTSQPAWAIQVGAFADEAAAKRLSNGLIAKGYPAKLLPASGEQRWRVRVQPIRDQDKANEMADRLKRIERLPTWVMPMEARSGS
jgi:cell division septation protein DedD